MTNPEEHLSDDIEEQQEAINTALKELTKVKAYSLKAGEIADFKAAQYTLRNLSEKFSGNENVAELYKTNLVVEGNERDLYE